MSNMSSAWCSLFSLFLFLSLRQTKMSFSLSRGRCICRFRLLLDYVHILLFFLTSYSSPFVFCTQYTTLFYTLSSIFIIFCKNIFWQRKRAIMPLFSFRILPIVCQEIFAHQNPLQGT